MSATEKTARDEIRLFLPGIGEEELVRRTKLRSYRNAASALITNAASDTARSLGWLVIEWATPNLYSPAPGAWLDQLNLLCKRLMLTAMQVEDMVFEIREGNDD